MIKIMAIIATTICDLFFIGGAVLLCVYKDWSLWTIFFGFVFACSSTSAFYKVAGVKSEETE